MQRTIALLGAGILLCLWGCDSGGGVSGVQPPPVAIGTTGGVNSSSSGTTGSTTAGSVKPVGTPASSSSMAPGPNSGAGASTSAATNPGPTSAGTTSLTGGATPGSIGTTGVSIPAATSSTAVSIAGGYTILAKIPVKWTPGAIDVNPTTNRVYLLSSGDPNDPNYMTRSHVQAIDGSTNQVTDLYADEFGNGDIVVNPTLSLIYFSQFAGDHFSVISTIDGRTDTINKNGFGEAGLMAVNPVTNRLYVFDAYTDKLVVMDGVTETAIAVIPFVYSHRNTATGHPIAVDPKTNRIYLGNGENGTIDVIDGSSNTLGTPLSIASFPLSITVNPVTSRIYVVRLANGVSVPVDVFDGETGALLKTITVPSGYNGGTVRVNSRSNRVYVPSADSKNVSVIDGSTNTLLLTLPVGDCRGGIAVNPNTGRLYAGNEDTNTVTVIAEPA